MHPIRSWSSVAVPSLIERTRPRDRDGLPVAPGWLPGVGHVPAMLASLPWVLREGGRLGPLFWVQFGPGAWQVMSVREEAMAVLRNRDTSSAHLARQAAVLVGRSVLGADGDAHRRMRGALNAPFTPKGLTASGAGAIVAEVVAPRVEGWRAAREVAVADETRELAVDVIFRMMGVPARDLRDWRVAFEEYALATLPIAWDLPGSPYRRGTTARRWIDDRLRAILRDARRDDPERSMVAAMAQGRDEEGRGLDEDELLDNLRVLVFAGHETTASVMAWATLHLAQHPDCWRRLVDEATSLDGAPTRPDQLATAPYAEGVFREALRLHPPIAMDSRETVGEWELLGRRLAPGTVVGVGLHELSRNAERYPEPDRFDPGRWVSRDRRPSPVETAQFGGGPHFCLGYHVAWLEVVHFLVSVARVFGRDGLRPVIDGAMPRAIYLPLQRPPRSARVRFER